MEITPKEITVKDIVKGYVDSNEEGVVGFNGKLNIRPAYQREFVYNEKQRNAVIETIRKDFPLNTMYWVDNGDGTYELLDGQQRTISMCEYVAGNFSLNYQFFHNLEENEQEQILNYKLMIYACKGTDKQKLDWFKIINIAGVQLTEQELRNAIYTGEWLTDAKRYFSRSNCVAYHLAADYLKGKRNRQDFLQTAIKWISNDNIEAYMAEHQHVSNANALWLHFNNVINWVKVIFPNYRREMKGVNFGLLFNQFKDATLDPVSLEEEVAALMRDEDVRKKSGIYTYVLTKNEKFLNIRAFSNNQKREAYERQKGVCALCADILELEGMEADHITPWHAGGKTIPENCQMLCKHCNRTKSGK